MATDPKMLGKALQSYQGRKLRADITPEEQARLQKSGTIGNKSSRYKSLNTAGPQKFIPSKEQH